MGNIDKRLEQLEATASGPKWEIPIEVRVHLKAVARHRARENGEELPAYSQEEIEAMREEDLEVISGGGTMAYLRSSGGWQSEEAQEMLGEWEDDARWRIEQTEGLPREMWGEVYEREDERI